MWLLLLDTLSRISFIFALLITAIIILYNVSIPYYIFPLLILATFLSYLINELFYGRAKMIQVVPYLFLIIFLPVDINLKFLITIICFLAYYISFTQKNVTYGLVVDHFKKTNPLALFIFLLSFLMRYLSTSRFVIMESVVIPSLIIYFVVSVLLLRTLRYLEYKIEDKRIVSVNFRYAVGVLVVATLLSIPVIRENIFWVSGRIFSFLYFSFVTLIGVIFIIIGYVLSWIFYFIVRFMADKGLIGRVNVGEFELNSNLSKFLRLLWERSNVQSKLIDQLLIISFYVIIIGVVVLILVWILRRVYVTYRKEENYIEEKEFLLPKINPIEIIKRIIKRESLGIIREYYRKYLLESKKQGVDLRISDTSYDVYEKTCSIFDSNVLKRVREIYINVRYGLVEVSSEINKEFLELFKKMHKNRL